MTGRASILSLKRIENGRGFNQKWVWLQNFLHVLCAQYCNRTPLQEILHPPLHKVGLTVKAKAAQCEYLGHLVGNGVVRPQESKIVAIESFARSETKKEVRTFLDLTGYYRRF